MRTRVPYILIVLFFACVWQKPENARAEEKPGYGVHLFQQGKYPLAILELERYMYRHPDEYHTPHAGLILALAYANESQYDEALLLLGELERAVAGGSYDRRYSDLLCEAGFHRLSILFRQKKFSEFDLEKERVSTLCLEPDERLCRYTDAMEVALEIYRLEWQAALQRLDRSRWLSAGLTARLRTGLGEAVSHVDRSPVLGGVFSIVPGMGHLYAGRTWDGIKSLLINATFVTLSAVCFTNDLPVAGGIFAGVEGVLYIANIYGGVNAVLQENARQAIERRDRMLKLLPAPPLKILSITEEFDIE